MELPHTASWQLPQDLIALPDRHRPLSQQAATGRSPWTAVDSRPSPANDGATQAYRSHRAYNTQKFGSDPHLPMVPTLRWCPIGSRDGAQLRPTVGSRPVVRTPV